MSTIEDNEMKFWMSEEYPPAAFMVREFLDLDASFKAFGGLPIAREWRIFASPEKVICYHPYWPAEDALAEMNAYHFNKIWFANPGYLRGLENRKAEIREAVK